MTDATVLEFFTLFLIGYTFSAFSQFTYILFYVKKGIKFLQETREVIFNHNDKEEFDKISKTDIPTLINLVPMLYFEIFLIFIVLAINIMAYLFTLVPESQTSAAWSILTYIASVGTAYIILSTKDGKFLIHNINAVCGSYNIILESYKHIEEYEGKNNDSSE